MVHSSCSFNVFLGRNVTRRRGRRRLLRTWRTDSAAAKRLTMPQWPYIWCLITILYFTISSTSFCKNHCIVEINIMLLLCLYDFIGLSPVLDPSRDTVNALRANPIQYLTDRVQPSSSSPPSHVCQFEKRTEFPNFYIKLKFSMLYSEKTHFILVYIVS